MVIPPQGVLITTAVVSRAFGGDPVARNAYQEHEHYFGRMFCGRRFMITAAFLAGTHFCQAQGDTTFIELGSPGIIVLPGSWDMVGQIDILGRFEVEFREDDSTLISLAVDRRDAFLIESDTSTLTAQHFVTEFYKMKKEYIDGLSHWSCVAVIQLFQDRSKEGCMVWSITDNCGMNMIGLYAADDVFVYDFAMRASTMREDEQAQFLVNAFHSLQ